MKDRIAISRALYQNPEILFFDEFHSALDLTTEKLVMEQIKKNSKKNNYFNSSPREFVRSFNEIWKLEKGTLKKID